MKNQLTTFRFMILPILITFIFQIGSSQYPDFPWPDGKKMAISLTFDDARSSSSAIGIPLLNEYDVDATYYIVPSNVQKNLSGWRAAVKAGHEMANHSLYHSCSGNFGWPRYALEDYTLDRMRAELDSCNAEIESLLGVRPVSYAYPCGQTTIGKGMNSQSFIPLISEMFVTGRLWLSEAPVDPWYCDMAALTGMKEYKDAGINPERDKICIGESFDGFQEVEEVFESVPRNQGITTDGKHFYVSPDHHTIEKRTLDKFELVDSATYPDKIGGLFYDSISDEILTCSGEYETGGDAFVSRINKNTLAITETIDISSYTRHGVNAIVRLNDTYYVGETAVNDDAEPKSWYSFDLDFEFIKTVYAHPSKSGSFDWQDATVYEDKIIATDHNGFVYAFCVLPDGQFHPLGKHDSSGRYYEGITSMEDLFYIWKSKIGIVSAEMK